MPGARESAAEDGTQAVERSRERRVNGAERGAQSVDGLRILWIFIGWILRFICSCVGVIRGLRWVRCGVVWWGTELRMSGRAVVI